MGVGAPEDDKAAGPLAEFAVLRQEMHQRMSTQHNVVALQLTISGAVFSFALTGGSRTGFLLIVPVVTYMLCSRFLEDHFSIAQLGRYIRDELAPRVPGGLEWESWKDRNPASLSIGRVHWIYAYVLAFPGVSALALAGAAPKVVAKAGDSGNYAIPVFLGLAAVWLLGAAVTVLCCLLLRRAVRPSA